MSLDRPDAGLPDRPPPQAIVPTRKGFDVGEALGFGWETTKSHLGFFIVLLIIVLIVYGIPQAISQAGRDNAGLALIGGLLSLVVGVQMQIGLTRIALKFVDGRQAEFSDLFSGFELFISMLIAAILVWFILTIGFLLLVVPGIILALILCFYSYAIVDRGLGPIDALKHSAAVTKGARMALLGFWIVAFLLNLVGLLALVIGLFVTGPITMVAAAYVYRKLDSQTTVVQTSGIATTT
jgi:hypothetical protein